MIHYIKLGSEVSNGSQLKLMQFSRLWALINTPLIIETHVGDHPMFKLQWIQTHIFTNSNYDADASILLNDLGWQNLET